MPLNSGEGHGTNPQDVPATLSGGVGLDSKYARSRCADMILSLFRAVFVMFVVSS